jgi:trimethylamine---corrinoid protein Co-methyltransferase
MDAGQMQLRILTDDQLDQVEATAFRLLEEVGISLQHERAREMLLGVGCRMQGERLLIPREVVTWALANVGREAIFRSRDGTQEVSLGQGACLIHNGGGDPNMIDFQTGERRLARLQDLADATRLLDALPNIDVVIPLVGPQDVPERLMTVASFEAMLHHTGKPIAGAAAEDAFDVRYMVELAAACCGGIEAFRQRPTIAIMVSPVSPLTFTEKVTDAILTVAEARAMFAPLPAPSMGATGPITMAGILAQQHAEVIASFLLAAATRPGTPVMYCSRINPLDMRSAVSWWGGPEIGMAGACATQLAHRHGFACDTYGLCTSATQIDAQLGYEKLTNALVPALAGADILSGAGVMDSVLTASLEVAVLDNELIGLMRHILRGYPVNEETLAYNIMQEVILADDSFLGQEHTVHHVRDGSVWLPEISERAMGTEDDPRLGVVTRARDQAREILDTHQVEPLPDDVRRHLAEIMAQAQREALPA